MGNSYFIDVLKGLGSKFYFIYHLSMPIEFSLASVLALKMSSSCCWRSWISSSMVFLAFVAAAAVYSESSSCKNINIILFLELVQFKSLHQSDENWYMLYFIRFYRNFGSEDQLFYIVFTLFLSDLIWALLASVPWFFCITISASLSRARVLIKSLFSLFSPSVWRKEENILHDFWVFTDRWFFL